MEIESYRYIPLAVGGPDDQNPYRSELAGIDGLLLAIALIVQVKNITHGSIEITLDGLAAKN